MPNIDLNCVDCGNGFFFSERDQAFYAEQNFSPPKRCWQCRQKRKNARGQVGREAVSTPKEDFSSTWAESPDAEKLDDRRSRSARRANRKRKRSYSSEESYD